MGVLDQSGDVYVCGNNISSSLGLGDDYLPQNQPNSGNHPNQPNPKIIHIRIVTPMKNPYLSDITEIDCGENHNFALNSKGEIFGFGSNSYGALGLGQVEVVTIPCKIKEIPEIKKISC